MRKVNVQDICNNIRVQKVQIFVFNWSKLDYEKVFEGNSNGFIPSKVAAATGFNLWCDEETSLVQIFVYDRECS